MPRAWLGSWYQRGMNSLLEITIDHIQTKGHCQDVLPRQQYYFFADRINRCTRCLLFIDRHPNVLQYRESDCTDADELSSVTFCPNVIAPDAPLYTLYRNNSKPQLCPIQPPLSLTSQNKDGSTCTQSSSYIGECANDYQFRLHLSPCSSFDQTLDLQLVCVATWIEGFNTYFVTRVLSKHHQHRYGCFSFITKQKDLSSFPLSMVTDASCRDLSSRQMATTMTLSSRNRRMDKQSNVSCIFPEELQEHQWYSLNRTRQLLITTNDMEFVNEGEQEKNERLHCLGAIDTFNYRIRSFTNCEVKDQCLRVNRRTNNVLELVLSNCHAKNDNRTLTFISTSNTSSTSSCSISIGHLLLESNLHHRSLIFQEKTFQMSVGCDKKAKLMIYQTEKDSEYRSLAQTDTCLASWQSTDFSTTYIIAQSIDSNASYCLSFQMSDSIIIRNNSQDCSFDHDENETSISIYSARLLNPCSQSHRSFFNTRLLLLTIVFLLHNNPR